RAVAVRAWGICPTAVRSIATVASSVRVICPTAVPERGEVGEDVRREGLLPDREGDPSAQELVGEDDRERLAEPEPVLLRDLGERVVVGWHDELAELADREVAGASGERHAEDASLMRRSPTPSASLMARRRSCPSASDQPHRRSAYRDHRVAQASSRIGRR